MFFAKKNKKMWDEKITEFKKKREQPSKLHFAPW